MSTRTVSDLAAEVLTYMCVIDPTETADSVDTNTVVSAYQNKWAELAAPAGDRELIYWPRDQIPSAVYLILRDLIINEVKGAFGEPMEPQEKDANEIVILKRLRKHVSAPQSGDATRSEYF